MNHQTKRLLDEAKKVVSDEGAFSEDQIILLRTMVATIGEAISKECSCVSSSCGSIDY